MAAPMREESVTGNEVFEREISKTELLDSNSEDEEIANLRAELSTIPFCELQALKEKVGVKKFNEALHGPQTDHQTIIKPSLKRKNKNRPREISSKKPVSKYKKILPASKKVCRDPRFDDLSGNFNEHMFDKAYSFLDDIRSQEKQQVQKAFKKEKDPEKKSELRSLLQRIEQNEKSQKAQKIQKEKKQERRKEELALIKQGKKPFYLKKSERKKLELAEKYQALKKSKKLDQYLKKRRKKNASKERKYLPGSRS